MSGEIPPASGELAVGSQVAGYQIEEQIGRGGMAVVYRASDPRLGRSVALKILAPELALDEAFQQRFLREMRAAAAVDHPHIVPVFDAGEANGALFIAMRYVSGQDVRTLLDRERTLPAARVARIVAQVASALDEAHSRGLVHRDVKPGNILIGTVAGSDQPDHAYLSDFGLSKHSVSSVSITSTGQFLGTLDYMAPEQIEGRPLDGRADLYALACTAYEMLTGVPPFRREEGLAVMWAQLSTPAPPLTGLRPDLPPAVDEVMARALAKAPDDRYQTCGAFADSLRAACRIRSDEQEPARSVSPASPPWPATEMAQIRPQQQPTSRPEPAQPADVVDPTDPQLRPATPWPAGLADVVGPTDPMLRPATSWPAAPPPVTPGRYPPGGRAPTGRRRRSGGRAAVVAGCIVLLAIAGVVFVVLRGRNVASSPPTGPTSPASSASPVSAGSGGPAGTVRAYVTAINNHDYAKAWNLGGKNTGSSYANFVHGFDGTSRDNLTVVSVTGDVVSVRLAATQTDGSVKDFQGTYTVSHGVITDSHIQPAG